MAASDTGQKTEAPTPKRMREARRRGQIPRSSDLVGWFTLLVASFLIPALAGSIYGTMKAYFAGFEQGVAAGEYEALMSESGSALGGVALALGAFLGFVMLITTVGMAVQGGITLTAEPLRPKLERISIKAGLKRLVSAQSAVDTIKAVVRLVVLALLVWNLSTSFISAYMSGAVRDMVLVGPELAASLLLVVRLAAFVGLAIGAADYAFQRYKIAKQLKMSKHEVKQESKQSEGDPMVRSRRRAMHAKLSQNQMLAAVGEASVVVVNPTHVAVALAYEPGMVPKVVAKGGDEVAYRIRERAFEAGVPVVEARPLARIMHDNLEIGAEVPGELYEAVAVIIAFVMRTPQLALDRMVRRVNVPPSKLLDVTPSTP